MVRMNEEVTCGIEGQLTISGCVKRALHNAASNSFEGRTLSTAASTALELKLTSIVYGYHVTLDSAYNFGV